MFSEGPRRSADLKVSERLPQPPSIPPTTARLIRLSSSRRAPAPAPWITGSGSCQSSTQLPLPDHTRRLIEACWDLDDAHPERMLARWAHMLGFRGHFSTKSRRYSTTLGALRQVRADYRARQERRERGLSEDFDDSEGSTLVLAHWTYAGQGHTPGESWPAESIAREIRLNRETAREALADMPDHETEGEW